MKNNRCVCVIEVSLSTVATYRSGLCKKKKRRTFKHHRITMTFTKEPFFEDGIMISHL